MTDDTTISTTVPVTVSGPAVATVTVTPGGADRVRWLRTTAALSNSASADGRLLRGRTVTWTTPDAEHRRRVRRGVVAWARPGRAASRRRVERRADRRRTQVRVAHAAEVCPFVATLALGQRADGTLALGDCEYSLDDSYVDVYEITLPAAGTIQIDMTST